MAFSFQCRTCGELHKGLPSFGPYAPLSYALLGEEYQSNHAKLGTDDCVIDGENFFIRGRLEIPIKDHLEPFVWLVWCSLSRDSYEQWRDAYDLVQRSHIAPFFGWLNVSLPFYEDTVNLATSVHLSDNGLRPLVEVHEAKNKLYLDQTNGILAAEAEAMVHDLLHPPS